MGVTLGADVEAVADLLATLLPEGLSGLGVAGVREFGRQMDAHIPPGPDVHTVTEHRVGGPHGEVPVRLYRPQSDSPLPVLLYIHGGGWTFGTLNGSVDHLCRSIASESGIAVVSVDYRLAPEHKFPIPVDESVAVLLWLREEAATLGVDSKRVAIGGDSAGGNIAAAITHMDRGNLAPLAAQVLIYPATEYAVERASWTEHANTPALTARDTLWFWDQYLRDETDRTDPRATPANAESFTGLPPAFVIVAGQDPLRDDGLHYAELLKQAGTSTQTECFDGAFHGFMNMPALAAYTRGVRAITRFLTTTLEP
ncbi:alpha/beta hydrolase [Nocardia tengchongensis]|uniref:alpha/beta hydrolase n=1 Tax=Nocardia tengchongensis TaxID=2055889 RepID=UPI00369C923E